MAVNINWCNKIDNSLVYGSPPKDTSKIRGRRMRLAGNIARHADLTAHQTPFSEPRHGQRWRARLRLTFTDMLRETGGDRECDARP